VNDVKSPVLSEFREPEPEPEPRIEPDPQPAPPPLRTQPATATHCFGTAEPSEGACVDASPTPPTCLGLVDDTCAPLMPGHRTCAGETDPEGTCLSATLATIGCDEGCEHAGKPGPLPWPCNGAVVPTSSTAPSHKIHVNSSADETGGDGSPEMPWTTLNMAVESAAPGDVILLAPGEYHGPIFITVPLTIRACGIELVTLLGEPTSNAFTLSAGGDVLIEGMTIAGGTTGVLVSGETSATLQNVRITDASGTGIHVDAQSSLELLRSRVENTQHPPAGTPGVQSAAISSAGSTHLQQVEVLGSKGVGIRMEEGSLSGEDVQVLNNQGGGIRIMATSETASFARFLIAGNTHHGIHVTSGKVALTDTRIEETQPHPTLDDSTTAGIRAEEGAMTTLTQSTIHQKGAGWALHTTDGFVNAEKTRFHCENCAGIMYAAAEESSNGTGSVLAECSLEGPGSTMGISLTGSHHVLLQHSRVTAESGVSVSGEDVLLEVEDSRIVGEDGIGIQGQNGSRVILQHAVVTGESTGIALEGGARLEADASEIIAWGDAPALSANHATGTLTGVRVDGVNSGIMLFGEGSQWGLQRSALEASNFANILITEGALAEVSQVLCSAPPPNQHGSGPFSGVVMNNAHLDIVDSSFGTLRIDGARLTASHADIRAVHATNPTQLIRLEDVLLGPDLHAAFLLQGTGGTSLLNHVQILEGSRGIALSEGASLMAESLDLEHAEGPGILIQDAEFFAVDARVENTNGPGIHVSGPSSLLQLSESLVRQSQGAGILIQHGKSTLENVWIEHTMNGGMIGAGDGVLAMKNALFQMTGGAIQFNERAGLLADASQGLLSRVTFHDNGMQGALNCVLQQNSQVSLEDIPVPTLVTEESTELPLPSGEWQTPEMPLLEVPEGLLPTSDP